MKTPGNAVKIELGEQWAYESSIVSPTWEYKAYQQGGREYWELCFSFGESSSHYDFMMPKGYMLATAKSSIWSRCQERITLELLKWFDAGWQTLYRNWGPVNITVVIERRPLGMSSATFASPVAFRITLVRG